MPFHRKIAVTRPSVGKWVTGLYVTQTWVSTPGVVGQSGMRWQLSASNLTLGKVAWAEPLSWANGLLYQHRTHPARNPGVHTVTCLEQDMATVCFDDNHYSSVPLFLSTCIQTIYILKYYICLHFALKMFFKMTNSHHIKCFYSEYAIWTCYISHTLVKHQSVIWAHTTTWNK